MQHYADHKRWYSIRKSGAVISESKFQSRCDFAIISQATIPRRFSQFVFIAKNTGRWNDRLHFHKKRLADKHSIHPVSLVFSTSSEFWTSSANQILTVSIRFCCEPPFMNSWIVKLNTLYSNSFSAVKISRGPNLRCPFRPPVTQGFQIQLGLCEFPQDDTTLTESWISLSSFYASSNQNQSICAFRPD